MIYLFFTGGSGNRGCEAIVRGTAELLPNQNMVVYSAHLAEDKDSNLDKIVECRRLTTPRTGIYKIISHFICSMSYHFGNGKNQVKQIYSDFLRNIKDNDLYLVIGGDVYCYDKPQIYYRVNELLDKNQKILWGCSIEPESIDDEMKKDLLQYDLIYARESITYDGLISRGITKNVKLYPDPAFAMKASDVPLVNGFIEKNTIGINVSPLIVEKESVSGITIENYKELIRHILNSTDCSVALIPHVIWKNSDDRTTLKMLFDYFKDNERVLMVDGLPAEQIKSYISKCRFMVAARTHASIAAYSTCVPTLVVGYSVKARGIAKDIFGDYEHYTIPVQSLKNQYDLLNSFLWLWDRETQIRNHLEKKIPEYVNRLNEIDGIISEYYH